MTEPIFLSVHDVAEQSDYTRSTVYNDITKGLLKVERLGRTKNGQIMVRKSEYNRWKASKNADFRPGPRERKRQTTLADAGHEADVG